MIKIIITGIICLFSSTLLGQSPDSNLTELFSKHSANQLLELLKTNEKYSGQIKEYLEALSFKIPILNPMANKKITSGYGYRIHPVTGKISKHKGLDLKGERMQKVYAAADGEIIEIGYNSLMGNFIRIRHILGFESLYGHLEDFFEITNSHIYQGQVIGFCGSSGRTTGVHLHFAILWKQEFLNPNSFIF
jgi:murein DD-endopeptidase MepM/ murein hydrolase activator NlpD